MKTIDISFKLFAIIALLLLKENYSAQIISKTEGSLISINYIDQTIDTSGIGNWEDTHYESDNFSSEYRFSFKMNSAHYLVNKFWNVSYTYDINSYSGVRFETVEEGLMVLETSHSNGWMDIIEPYMVSRTKLLQRPNGVWLLNGRFGNDFYNISDSLIGAELLYICGKIGDEYLIVDRDTLDYSKYKFYLDSLNISPSYSQINEINVVYKSESIDPMTGADFNNPVDLTHLSGDLYIATRTGEQCLDLFTFRNDSLIQLKQFTDPEFLIDYRVINKSLYCNNEGNLVKMGFDFLDSTFIQNTDIELNVAYGLLTLDINSNNYAFIKNDSLIVGNLITEKRMYEIDLGSFNIKNVKPVIDSPYVYLHQVDKITDVEYDNLKEISQFLLLQNYPNPFNPSTTIKYSISVEGANFSSSTTDIYVTLKIYDILGRKVETLINQAQKAGNYEVEFDATHFSSGVYYYQLRVGNFIQSKKMLLLK